MSMCAVRKYGWSNVVQSCKFFMSLKTLQVQDGIGPLILTTLRLDGAGAGAGHALTDRQTDS